MPWRHAPDGAASGGFVTVELAQTGPREFTLRAPLVHEARPHPGGAGGPGAIHVVPAGFTTDLVSVPFPLWALIGPFGRQTRAAILHDHAVRSLRPPRRTPERLREREAVDRRFRDALLDSDVPRLRAYLLWAGTSLDRILRHAHPVVAAALVAQLAAGLALLVTGARVGGWVGLVLALLPLPVALLWGRSRLAVVLLQYVGALVLPVILLNAAASGLLALLSLLVGGRPQGISPTRLPGPAAPVTPSARPGGEGRPPAPPRGPSRDDP